MTGTITSIETKGRRSNRRSVFIDGEAEFEVEAGTVVALGLEPGLTVDLAQVRTAIEDEEYKRAKDMALNFLSYRSRTRKQMTDYLTRKGYGENIAARVLEKLQQLDLVDDRKFAFERVSRGIEHEGSGPLKLRQDLWRQGVDRRLADACLTEAMAGRREEDYALETARARLSRMAGLPAREAWHRLYGFLARRGYSPDSISSALGKLLGEIDE